MESNFLLIEAFLFLDYVACIRLPNTKWFIFKVCQKFIHSFGSIKKFQIYLFIKSFTFRQFMHYGEEVKLGYFGKYRDGAKSRQRDFDLSKITAPISIHFSIHDRLADEMDVEKLRSKLKNVVFVQRISELFNHVDFVWGIRSASLIYSKILEIFQKYSQ